MAKFDMFNGKRDDMRLVEKQLNKWYDDLIWCPSQCYYYFMHDDDMYCIYLRWRHQNPWTAEIIKCAEGDFNLNHESSMWKFKIGDIVEVLEGRRLYTAIVAALPPTPEDNFPILDALDDCYLVLPMDSGPIDHLHIAPTHTFTLQHPIEKEGLDYLRNRLLIYQGHKK